MSNNCAPIALFAYNRLDHLKRVIEALQENDLASESEIFIFSDGPKQPADLVGIRQIREYLNSVSGFKTVNIVEQEKNIGLAQSIINGVTKLTEDFGQVIVVEDDVVTSKNFLSFMNSALQFYRNDAKVMHISGYNFPMTVSDDSSASIKNQQTYFIVPTTCWGWATWKRAWTHFNRDVEQIIAQFTPAMINEFNLNQANPYFQQLIQNQLGTLNTWAIFWYAAVFLNKGLSLHPVHSFCINIGHDGTGKHCAAGTAFDVVLETSTQIKFETNIQESPYFRKKVEQFFKETRPSILTRIKNRLKRICS